MVNLVLNKRFWMTGAVFAVLALFGAGGSATAGPTSGAPVPSDATADPFDGAVQPGLRSSRQMTSVPTSPGAATSSGRSPRRVKPIFSGTLRLAALAASW